MERVARLISEATRCERQTTRPARRTGRLKYKGDELLHPRQAAVEMLDEFRSLARHLAPGDLSTQDDLVQEMAMSALLCRQPQHRSSYRLVAVWRALDYLRWWRLPVTEGKPETEQTEPTSAELEKLSVAIEALTGAA